MTECAKCATVEEGPVSLSSSLNIQDESNEAPFWLPSKPSKYRIAPGKLLPPIPGSQDNYLVSFDQDDPEHPFHWPTWKKYLTITIASLNIIVVGWGSSSISTGINSDNGIEEHFHLGSVPSTLVLSLFTLGYTVGQSIWGPMSEMFGRQLPFILGILGFCIFTFGAAAAKDIQTLLICRFFMGTMGNSAVVIGPALTADLFDTSQRSNSMAFVNFSLWAGPILAPVANGYIAYDLGWRWTMYVTAFIGCFALVLQVFFVKESYAQAILKYRAVHMRKETGNWAINAAIENMELDTMNIINRTILKPTRLLIVEPILLIVSVYMGLVYSILYMFFIGLPIIFGEHYRWNQLDGNARGNTYLPFSAMLVGCILMVSLQLFFIDDIQAKLLRRRGLEICPETRLPAMMIGGLILPPGLFLTCWSAQYVVHWIVPCIGLALVGIGFVGIYQSGLLYIVDTYSPLAASSVGSNTFVRSGMAAGFPLFAAAMFHNEGIQWAGTILGCLTALLAVFPFVFYIWGEKIRGLSKFAAKPGVDQEDLRVELAADKTLHFPLPGDVTRNIDV